MGVHPARNLPGTLCVHAKIPCAVNYTGQGIYLSLAVAPGGKLAYAASRW